jgi:radical SAM superfamily enzyme YgiQ (UPF0313 family)
MRYEEPVYRPPSEAASLLIQATIGCPHNKCTFCGMYKGKRFRIRRVEEIKEDLQTAREFHGSGVRSLFLPDANTIFMKTSQLIEILQFARELFPHLERITVYGSAKFIKLKSLEELKSLRAAGLSRIHAGLESGDDVLLARLRKGATANEMIEAGLKVKEAGIELSEYILIGIGGLERTKEHALESARVLNAINPHFIRLRTWVPVPSAPLYKDYASGKFKLLSPYDALAETRLLIENLNITSYLASDHISNFINLNGQLPQAKEDFLAAIDKALKLPREMFRDEIIYQL